MKAESRELLKKEYRHLDALYFNSAYFGPSPYRAKQKISNAVFKELDPSFYPYNTWMGIPDRIRTQLAQLINCKSDSVALSTSVSDVINLVANGISLKKDDVVVAMAGDYPSNVLPWMLAQENRGINFQLIDLPVPTVEGLKKSLPKKTRVLNLSHVSFDTGRKVNLEDIGQYCQENGILFVVDATQSLGGVKIGPNELAKIDVLAVASYKWMLGPYGHAFAYFSDRALEQIKCTMASWTKSPNSKSANDLLRYTTETLPGARRFDRGQPACMLLNSALEAGVEVLQEVGLDEIQSHNESLRDHFLENFPKEKYKLITPKDQMGNILSLASLDIDPLALETELKHHNVDISVREGKLRLSFHLFNTKKQVNTLMKAMDI